MVCGEERRGKRREDEDEEQERSLKIKGHSFQYLTRAFRMAFVQSSISVWSKYRRKRRYVGLLALFWRRRRKCILIGCVLAS